MEVSKKYKNKKNKKAGKFLEKLFIVVLACSMIGVKPMEAEAAPGVSSEAAVVMDMDSGAVLRISVSQTMISGQGPWRWILSPLKVSGATTEV